MASILSLIAGLVVGAIAGWLLRGRQIARTQSAEAHVPAQSTGSADSTATSSPAQTSSSASSPAPVEDNEKAPALVGAKSEDADVTPPAPIAVVAEPAPVAEPVTPVFEPAAAEPVATEPVAPVAPRHAAPEPEIADPVAAEPVITEPVITEPVIAAPAVTEPVTAEPVATEPVAAELAEVELVEAEIVTVQTIAEPDDLTKIAGIGPKMAMALAASGITTFEQLAATPLPDIRAAVSAAGMRLAPSAPTWPDQAKALARITD